MGDTGQAQHTDVEDLSTRPHFFEILTTEMPQPQLYSLSRNRLFGRIGVTLDLVSDSGTDEVGAVRVEPFLHHQVDMAEIHVAEVDRDLLAVGNPFRHVYHLHTIHPDGYGQG